MKRIAVSLLVLIASGVVQAQGWEGGKPTTKPQNVEQLSAEEQARYDAVAQAIVAAINVGDAKALEAMFSAEAWSQAIDWWHNAFAHQVKRFGPIVKAWSPRRGILKVGDAGIGGDARNGASFLAHFEKPCGAALSFELDAQDKIVYSSCWVQEPLGQAEPDSLPLIYEAKRQE